MLWQRRSPLPALFILAACGSPLPVAPPATLPAPALAPAASIAPRAPPPPPPSAHLTAGSAHACAVEPGGAVYCWGDNVNGQLGDGSMETRTRATRAHAPPDTVALAAGEDFTCALDRSGHVTCWGAERPAHFQEKLPASVEDAMLKQACARGDANACRSVAVIKRLEHAFAMKAADQPWYEVAEAPGPRPPAGAPIPGLDNVEEIAAGGTEVCARSKSGSVSCFAIAAPSSRFYSSAKDSPRYWRPVAVPHLDDAVHIAAGLFESCAVRRSGQVVCWKGAAEPKPVAGISDGAGVAVGLWHTCVLKRSGTVTCWIRGGANTHGELGGHPNDAGVAEVDGIGDAVSIAAGGSSTCVRRATHKTTCWGELTHQGGPSELDSLDGPSELAVGDNFACASRPGGTVRCWGASARGRLGRGIMPETPSPHQVTGLSGIIDVEASDKNSCALRGDGSVVCWGGGYPNAAPDWAPLAGLSQVRALSGRDAYACAVETSGMAACWAPGQPPQALEGVADVVAVGPSVAGVCAARRTGQVACAYPGFRLQTVPGVGGAVDTRVGDSDWACARRGSGSITCWETQVNAPGFPRKTKLAVVPSFHDVVDFETRGLLACAVRRTGAVECFGSLHPSAIATPVAGVTDATAISMGASEMWSCILRRNGKVACHASENRWGEMGEGPLGLRGPYFVDVAGVSDAKRVAVGDDHVCAVTRSGSVWCWGNDDQGQVSGHAVGAFLDPADVVGLGP